MKSQADIQNDPASAAIRHLPHCLEMLPGPFYFYDMELLEQTSVLLMHLAERDGIKVHYALKANNNAPILKLLSGHGLGADCVSGGEIRTALEAGFRASEIVFAGVGKSDEEIKFALEQDILCFNCESLDELEVINDIAAGMGIKARIALRINPDFDAGTHKKITTATRNDKFGIQLDELESTLDILRNGKSLEFKGLHFHIGSQILDINTFVALTAHINSIQKYFKERGFFPQIINAGGGLGVNYQNPDEAPIPDFAGWIGSLSRNIHLEKGQQIHIEPGRSLVAQCGYLLSKVLYIKKGPERDFAIIDAGMNDLMRPALYGAEHKIQKLGSSGANRRYTVAGPVCESSDIFARDVLIQQLKRNDRLVIRSAGAYGQSMASSYNMRSRIPDYYSGNVICS